MTLSEAIELTDFSQAAEFAEILANEYTEVTEQAEVLESTECTIYMKSPSSPKFSISFHPENNEFPQDFSYMLWLGDGNRLWMQVHAPVSPTTSSVYTHTIPHGTTTSTDLKSWVVGISHNSSEAIQIRVCEYGWNNELITTLPATPDTITVLDFDHPVPFGTAVAPTTRYVTHSWCSAKLRSEATKTNSPGAVTAVLVWSLTYNTNQYASRIFSNVFVGNSAPAGTYSTYVNAYPLLPGAEFNGDSKLELILHRSNTSNISTGFIQLLSDNFTGSITTTFNGAYMYGPDTTLGSACSFTE